MISANAYEVFRFAADDTLGGRLAPNPPHYVSVHADELARLTLAPVLNLATRTYAQIEDVLSDWVDEYLECHGFRGEWADVLVTFLSANGTGYALVDFAVSADGFTSHDLDEWARAAGEGYGPTSRIWARACQGSARRGIVPAY